MGRADLRSKNTRHLAGALLITASAFLGCSPQHVKQGSVSLGEHGFVLNGRPFFPLAVNYGVALCGTADSLWACPAFEYAVLPPQLPATHNADRIRLKADMEMISDMGFNTVRLVGFGEAASLDSGLFARVKTPWRRDTVLRLSEGSRYEQYLSAIGDVLDAVRSAGIRSILLVTIHPDRPATEQHFIRIADRFRNDTTVLAYDIFNEPLYFDKPERPKKEAMQGPLPTRRELEWLDRRQRVAT